MASLATFLQLLILLYFCTRASAENFPGEGGNGKKRPKNSTIKPLPGGGKKNKTDKIAKKYRKIALLKPLSTIFVPCMKNENPGRHGPRCRRPFYCNINLQAAFRQVVIFLILFSYDATKSATRILPREGFKNGEFL